MYAKLALRNAKKSMKDYLIYMITLTLCVGLFYAFISLSSPNYGLIIQDVFDLSKAYNALGKMAYIISSLLIILIKYVNDYMIKRKKKEFALHTLMGMEQKTTAYIFFFETTVMGLISILIGMGLGCFLLQIISVIILPAVGEKFFLTFPIYSYSIIRTVILFVSILLIIGFWNIKTISRLKIINMLKDDRVTEVQKSHSDRFYVLVGCSALANLLISLASGKKYLYLSTLTEDAALGVSSMDKSWFMLIAIVAFIAFIYLFYYSCTYIILVLRNKMDSMRYRGTNLFILGQLSAKIKSNAILMSTVTISIMISIILLVFGSILSGWVQGFGDMKSVLDLQVTNSYHDIRYFEDLPNVNYEPVAGMVQDLGYSFKDYEEVDLYFLSQDDFYKRRKDSFPILAMSLSDYNKLRAMQNLKQINLENNTYTTHWNRRATDAEKALAVEAYSEISVVGISMNIDMLPVHDENLGSYLFNKYTLMTFVLPDDICENLIVAKKTLVGNTKRQLSYKDAVILEEVLDKKYKDELGTQSIIIKTLQENRGVSSGLLVNFICIYSGVVFLIISFTILSLQQLSDAYEHKKRFHILKKLGISEGEINSIIRKQMAVWFGTPVAISLLWSGLFIYGFYMRYFREVNVYIGREGFVFNVLVTLGCVALIQGLYLMVTYELFRKNVASSK